MTDPSAAAARQEELPARIAGRYVVEAVLGRGGMGYVYRVRDESSGQALALKQLQRKRAASNDKVVALFQREYQTLAQLRHPNIIDVYDYGIEGDVPYYTMELLDGEDLRELAPLPWRQACRVLRDVCSALAMLHSRRLLHRDPNPYNVRCTRDGRAKLIDFGTMATMGSTPEIFGTPPFIPPEAILGKPLDARSDLFGLGALAYWVLTDRHAYPARRVSNIREVWRHQPRPPSAHASAIPEALDELVMSMTSLDPLARPVSTAEVLERLAAIAQLDGNEEGETAQAYLNSPVFVGRERELERLTRRVARTMEGRGGTVVVDATTGLGRTRLLQEFIVRAKLAGATVISATPSAREAVAYDVIRELGDELMRQIPEVVLEAAKESGNVLASVLPALAQHFEPRQPEGNARQQRAALQAHLSEWLLQITSARALVVAVDDIGRCDEPSAAVLAAIGSRAREHKLLVVATVERQASRTASAAIHALEASGMRMRLHGFDRASVESLLASVFGVVPNLKRLSDWAFETTRGNPLECMELSRHLVARGIARHINGQWSLPQDLSDLDLPSGLAEAFDARVAALEPRARRLAEALCLYDRKLPLDMYARLVPDEDKPYVFQIVDDLVAAEVLVGEGDGYRFSQPGLVDAIQRGIDPQRRQDLHRMLGSLLAENTAGDPTACLEAGYHLLRGGAEHDGVELVLEASARSRWAEGFETPAAITVAALQQALNVCERTRRCAADCFRLRSVLITFAYTYDHSLLRFADRAIEQIRQDSGLALVNEQDGVAPSEVLDRALELAEARYQSTPVSQRGLPPQQAVAELVTTALAICSVAGVEFDLERMRRAVEILEPLRQTPLKIWWELVISSQERLRGQVEGAHARRLKILRQLDNRRWEWLEGAARQRLVAILLHLSGLHESVWAPERALECARALEEIGGDWAVGAWQIRMLRHLFNGNSDEAQRCREQMELLAIQAGTSEQHRGISQPYVARAYAMSGDLMGLKHTLEELSHLADTFPGYAPFLRVAVGNYRRLRGEVEDAQAVLEQALRLVRPGRHAAWGDTIVAYVEVLVASKNYDKALRVAQRARQDAEIEQVEESLAWQLASAISIAEAKTGNIESAKERLVTTIEQVEQSNVAGLILGNLYETQAQVALLAGDAECFEKSAARTETFYKAGSNPALTAKYERLIAEARTSQLTVRNRRRDELAAMSTTQGEEGRASLRMALRLCRTARERADRALRMLIEHSRAVDGCLFGVQADGLQQLASSTAEVDQELVVIVKEFIDGVTDEECAVTRWRDDLRTDALTNWKTDSGRQYQAVLLGTFEDEHLVVVGAAALALGASPLRVPEGEVLSEVSDALIEAGDVTPLIVHY